MKKPSFTPKQTRIIIAIIIILVILGLGAYIKRDGIARRIYSHQVRSTFNEQIEPLNDSLERLGFTDLPKPQIDCRDSDTTVQDSSLYPQCTASITKYVKVGSMNDFSGKLNFDAKQLSQALNSNGWKQRKDLPTTAWFAAIGKGIDYQPDQLNIKQIGDTACTLDFFTAFSQPAPPATNLMITCTKPAKPLESSLFE